MGRAAQAGGWRIRIPPGPGNKVYSVRFRHLGRRYEKSTGRTDPKEAATEAARIYAEIVSGRTAVRSVGVDLTNAVAAYLADHEKENSREWSDIVATYFRAHLIPFFGSFERFTVPAYGDYGRERLLRVTRTSVRHELSALRRFVEWCNERGMGLPEVPSLPKHGKPGVRAKNARKRKATIVTPDEARRILMAMPERSVRTGSFIRPLFQVLWETGLRPATVLRLEAPLHYQKGAKRLFVSREIDKEGFERWIPLSPAARSALDRVCPKEGRLFDNKKGALKVYMRLAVARAGLTDRNISPYDFKHTRISIAANTPGVALTGVAHLVGHKHVSTTALYVQSAESAAEHALRAMSGGRSGGRKTAKRRAKGGT